MIAKVAGGVMGAVGAMSNASATASADTFNASMASQSAVAVQQQADQDVELLRRRAQQTIGKMAATYGASGVTLEGSPTDALANSASNAALDAQTVEYKAGIKIAGYGDINALDRLHASNAMTAGMFASASDVITGAGSAISTYNKSQQDN